MSTAALASQDQLFGLGGESSGRVGGVTASPDTPFAALYNPGLLAAGTSRTFSVSTAVARARFKPFPGVLVDSPQYRTDSGETRTRDYQLAPSELTLWSLGLNYPFALPPGLGRRAAGFGIAVSGPMSRLRTFQALTPYDFRALRYGTSDAQFKGTLAASVEVVPGTLYAGAGVSLYITSAGDAEATITAENPTGRFALDVGMNSAAVAGLFGRFGNTGAGLTYRQAVRPAFLQRFIGRVQFGGVDTLYQPLLFQSTLYYEPDLFEGELQHDFGPATASIGVSWQLWSAYEPSFLVARSTDAGGRERATSVPKLPLRNTVAPRAAVVVPLVRRTLTISGGYQFRPTPLTDLSGPANLVDADTHVVGLAAELRLDPGGGWPPARLGLFGQHHWITSRQVAKASRDLIGAPGYTFGGTAWTMGLSLQAEL